MQQNKMNLSDDLVVLLNRLAQNGDIRMAGHVLHAYLIRFWKMERDDATRFIICYFEKHYPKQLQRYVKKRRHRN
ncbi:hypothetical protein I532_24617 [Brevibacillus borstelensis AK1]|uniref:Uncharacterized protein n=1 Tax=Brevibacillus borstelensis AK1 TaxID=1300222 RepID=M8D1D6_9BACL|nr:hypothetical protein [Brevibacillus borstelensis]EMT50029.1 hypothetical protein I532_24617 [Brevibacillus borstelensis AK1]